MIDPNTLRNLVETDHTDLAGLAKIAGGDPKTFYRGANFNNADLRGEDLRGFDLTDATFKRVRVDRTTRVDKEFLSALGLERTVGVFVPLGEVISSILKIPKSASKEERLGDLIEDALFGERKDVNRARAIKWAFDVTESKTNNALGQKELPNSSRISILKDRGFYDSENIFHSTPLNQLAKEVGKLYRNELSHRNDTNDLRFVSITSRTHNALKKMSRREKINIADLCSALLFVYAVDGRSRRRKDWF